MTSRNILSCGLAVLFQQPARVYVDKGVSGAAEKRPGLDALLDDCRRRKCDVVVVWKFDRFARSLRQLVNALETFRKLGIAFVSCTEAIDTSLPHGEMLFQIIGAIAQWERSLIAERVKAGLEHARSQGKRLGRPALRELSSKEVARLRSERTKSGAPFRALAQKYGISVGPRIPFAKNAGMARGSESCRRLNVGPVSQKGYEYLVD